MKGDKKRRGPKITSRIELLDREPYRTVIEVINHLEKVMGEAEPKQILFVINAEEPLYTEHVREDQLKNLRNRVYNKAIYENRTKEVKSSIQSRPDKSKYNLTKYNLRDYLNTLIQWGIVEKLERGRYQIAPSLKNEIIRKSNKRIIDYYARDDISDFSESKLIVYGFEYLRKQLEEADRSEYAQKLSSKYPDRYWYSISTEFEEDLNKGVIPQELKDKGKADFMIGVRRIEEWWEKKDCILMQYSKWLPRILSLSDKATITKIRDWCLLFCIDAKFEDDLNKNSFPEELKDKFKSYFKRMYNRETPFSDSATITKGEGNEWQIDNERRQYIIRKEGDELKIYNRYAARMSIGKEWIIEDGEEFVARKEGNKLNIYNDLVLLPGEDMYTPIQDLRLFSIDAKFEDDFNKNIIPQELKDKFKSYFKEVASFFDSATVIEGKGDEWIIEIEGREFIIRKEGDELKIYNSYAARRRIGKDHITIIENRIDRIKHELEELHKEKAKATSYLSAVDTEQYKIYDKYLDKFRNDQKENLTKEQKENLFDIALNFQEQTLNIMFGVEDRDEKSVKDYEKYVKEKLLPLPPPTLSPILDDITLFYSEKLELPSSVEVAIGATRWNSASKDKTKSEEELEEIAKNLYQNYGNEILKFVQNAMVFAYYAGKFGPIRKGEKNN